MHLLGDLFPAEWPPASAARRPSVPTPAAAFPPPSHMRKRAAIAKSLEPCTEQFRRLVAFGAGSESRMVRCAVVRLCSKAAGLGGGMGMLLAAPLLEELHGVMRGSGPLCDARRVLEIMVPLAIKPALKAALLDLKAVSTLARYLHRLTLKLAEEQGAQLVITMVLEALAILINPDVCLNPLAPRATHLLEDCPTFQEAAALVTALLACLPQLAATATMAQNLLMSPSMGLNTHPGGRAAIRQGALKWFTTTTHGGAASAAPSQASGADAEQCRAALTWAATKLWEAAERMREPENDKAVSACQAVAKLLEQLAAAEDVEEEDTSAQPLPAPSRFAAAVQAACTANRYSPEDDDGRSELLGLTPQLLVCDATTQAFWRYAKARAGKGPLSKKLTKWDVQHGVSSASKLFGEGVTRRKRTRDAKQPQPAAGKAPPHDVAQQGGKRPRTTDEQLQAGGAAAAGRGRRDIAPKGRQPTGSRPPSRHVDDYERPDDVMARRPPYGPPPTMARGLSPGAGAVPGPRPPPGQPPRPPVTSAGSGGLHKVPSVSAGNSGGGLPSRPNSVSEALEYALEDMDSHADGGPPSRSHLTSGFSHPHPSGHLAHMHHAPSAASPVPLGHGGATSASANAGRLQGSEGPEPRRPSVEPPSTDVSEAASTGAGGYVHSMEADSFERGHRSPSPHVVNTNRPGSRAGVGQQLQLQGQGRGRPGMGHDERDGRQPASNDAEFDTMFGDKNAQHHQPPPVARRSSSDAAALYHSLPPVAPYHDNNYEAEYDSLYDNLYDSGTMQQSTSSGGGLQAHGSLPQGNHKGPAGVGPTPPPAGGGGLHHHGSLKPAPAVPRPATDALHTQAEPLQSYASSSLPPQQNMPVMPLHPPSISPTTPPDQSPSRPDSPHAPQFHPSMPLRDTHLAQQQQQPSLHTQQSVARQDTAQPGAAAAADHADGGAGAGSSAAGGGGASDAAKMPSPAQIMDLLKDPVRLQRLLKQNPTLAAVLARQQKLTKH